MSIEGYDLEFCLEESSFCFEDDEPSLQPFEIVYDVGYSSEEDDMRPTAAKRTKSDSEQRLIVLSVSCLKGCTCVHVQMHNLPACLHATGIL